MSLFIINKKTTQQQTFFSFILFFFPIPLENVCLFTRSTNISWTAPDVVALSLEILLISHLTVNDSVLHAFALL